MWGVGPVSRGSLGRPPPAGRHQLHVACVQPARQQRLHQAEVRAIEKVLTQLNAAPAATPRMMPEKFIAIDRLDVGDHDRN